MSEHELRQIPLTALFIALAIVLPQAFHFIGAGAVFLPMFLPVFLSAFVLDWKYTFIVSLLSPLISFLITGMPPIVPPILFLMLIELTAAVTVIWLIFQKMHRNIFTALITAIIVDRIVYFFFMSYGMGLLGYDNILFPLSMTLKAFPGIILQLIVIPLTFKIIKEKYPQLINRRSS